MNTPITSRIKRSPLLKYSPLKNDKDPKATTGGSVPGDKKKVVTTSKSTYDGPKMSDEEWNALTPEKRRELNAAVGANEQGEIIKQTETEVEGDPIDYDTTLYTKKESKRVLDPIEVRRQERAGTVINRKINKYERQMGRYGTFDEKGEFTANPNLSQREMRKLRQAKANLKGAKSASANVQAGRETGMNIGEQFYGGQRQMDKGERTDVQQTAEAKRQARLEEKQKIADEKGITTGNSGQASKAIKPGQQIQNMAAEFDASKYALDFNIGDYSNLLNKRSPANMKSSPAKKALKGNQYKLPQHLQEAIKAAPGKLRTPMKKGYFKNK